MQEPLPKPNTTDAAASSFASSDNKNPDNKSNIAGTTSGGELVLAATVIDGRGVAIPATTAPPPPSLDQQSVPTSALISLQSKSGVPPRTFVNAGTPPEFCITLPPHIKSKDTQRFFYGDAAYYFHVSPNGKTQTSFGLSLDAIEKMMQSLSAQYSGVLTATGSDEDDFMRMIDKISQEVSAKRQAIVTLSQKSGSQGHKEIVEKYVVEIPGSSGPYPALSPAFETFWQEIKSFGNLPHTMSFMKLVYDSKVAHTLKDLVRQHDINMFENDFNLRPLLAAALFFIKKAFDSYTTYMYDNNKDEIEKIMKAFVELHEYLYRQQIMKKIVELHNAIAEKAKAGFSPKSPFGVLKRSVLQVLDENSKAIPEFKMFITYECFCKKVRYLIDAIENAIPVKKNLLKCLDDIVTDVGYPTPYMKYEKLVERLYNAVWTTYNTVQGLDDEAYPDKWHKFKELLVIISYLNSSENPFARQNPGQPEKYSPFHQEALKYFEKYQNSLTDDKPVLSLMTEETLNVFFNQESSVLTVKVSEMTRSGTNTGTVMHALSLLPSDELLLPYLNEPINPAASKGALVPAPKGAAAKGAGAGARPVPGPGAVVPVAPVAPEQQGSDKNCRMM